MYTRNSPIQGVGTASAEAVQAWFVANAARGASWVGLPVAPIPADLGASIVRSAGRYGFNSDLGAAQIAHETAFGQSRIFRDKLNPAGIGAENDDPYGKALAYKTVADGCDAWAAHLAGYVLGDGPWNALSPRYAIVKANGWAGKVRTLADLEQKWAWTPQAKYDATPLVERYGSKVSNHANDLVDFANNQTWETPMALALPTEHDLGFPVQVMWADGSVKGRYEGITDEMVAQRKRLEILWQVVHDTEGWWPTDRDYLRIGHDASARAVIAPDGTVCIMVPLDEIAWTGGSSRYNALGAHYEVSGFAHIGYADPQYRALAALIVFDNRQMKNPPPLRYVGRSGEKGIIGHSDIPNPIPGVRCNGQWGGASCHDDPGGKFDWNRLAAYINDITQGAPVPTPQPAIPGAQLDPWNEFGAGNPYAKAQGEPFWILDPFVDWIKDNGFWSVGFAISGAFIPDDSGILTQFFEGGALEWHPEIEDPKYRVLRRHTGVEVLRSIAPDRVIV